MLKSSTLSVFSRIFCPSDPLPFHINFKTSFCTIELFETLQILFSVRVLCFIVSTTFSLFVIFYVLHRNTGFYDRSLTFLNTFNFVLKILQGFLYRLFCLQGILLFSKQYFILFLAFTFIFLCFGSENSQHNFEQKYMCILFPFVKGKSFCV